MPKEIQNPRTSSGVAAALGVKGRFPLQVDEVGVLTYPLFRMDQSPYGREATPCSGARSLGAAGAGIFSGIGVRSAPGVILEVREMYITIMSAANIVNQLFWVDGTTWALWTATTSVNMVNLSVLDPQVTPVVPFTPTVQSVVQTLTRNVALPAASVIWQGQNATNTFYRVVFPYGVFLDGDAALGAPGLILSTNAANNGVHASFLCREWQPKG